MLGTVMSVKFTDVVDYCTAEVLKAGCVADQAERRHLARDLQHQPLY